MRVVGLFLNTSLCQLPFSLSLFRHQRQINDIENPMNTEFQRSGHILSRNPDLMLVIHFTGIDCKAGQTDNETIYQ